MYILWEMKKKSLTKIAAGNPVSDQRTQAHTEETKNTYTCNRCGKITSPELAGLIIENIILVNLTKNELAVKRKLLLIFENLIYQSTALKHFKR